MSGQRLRFTVYRQEFGGDRLRWLVLDEANQCSVAACESRRDAARVAGALNNTEDDE